MAVTFYGDITKAAELAGVDETALTESMQEVINNFINSEVRTDGFLFDEVTEYHDVKDNNKQELMLKKYPVIEGTVVVTDNAQSDNPTVLDSDSIFVDTEAGIIQLKSSASYSDTSVATFTKGPKAAKVVYTHGFETVPDLIAGLATSLIAKKAKIMDQNADADGIKSFTAGNYRETKDLSFLNVKSEFDDDINSALSRAKILYYLE